MRAIDLTEEEHAAAMAAARKVINGDKFLNSPRLTPLKSALAKRDPGSVPKPPSERKT